MRTLPVLQKVKGFVYGWIYFSAAFFIVLPTIAHAATSSSASSVSVNGTGISFGVGIPYNGAQTIDCYTGLSSCAILISTTTPYTILSWGIIDGTGNADAVFFCNSSIRYYGQSFFDGFVANSIFAATGDTAIMNSDSPIYCDTSLETQNDTAGAGQLYWFEYVPYDTRTAQTATSTLVFDPVSAGTIAIGLAIIIVFIMFYFIRDVEHMLFPRQKPWKPRR